MNKSIKERLGVAIVSEIRWKIPLGEVPELAARGITDTGSHFPKVNPVVTAGGFIFTGTRDRKVRALDSETGKVLWEATVDAALGGMPAVYEQAGNMWCSALPHESPRTHKQAIPPRLQTGSRAHTSHSLFSKIVFPGLPATYTNWITSSGPERISGTESDHLRHSKFAGLHEYKNARSVVKEHASEA